MDLTLVLPPLCQLNTPYPSTAYLSQFLREHGIACKQRDLGLELVLRLFSRDGLSEVFGAIQSQEELPEPAWRALSMSAHHLRVIEPVIAFLQGRDSSLAPRIVETPFLPTGPRLEQADVAAFGRMGIHDAARYLATLYLEDLSDLITACIDPGFGIARYQAHLATGARSFDPLWQRLAQTTLVDSMLDELCDSIDSAVVGLSVPFPGNLYGALRIGKRLKDRGATVLLGGGYVNTELRDLDEPRVWQCVDAVTYDDGEGPLVAILEHLEGKPDRRHRTRTVEGLHDAQVTRPSMTCAGTYGELELGAYLQLIDTLNPGHRLWADGRWNKITVAHGCYWKRCTFCDVHLDYVRHYESAAVGPLVDHMERLIEETGQRGFHFVDEAAPPRALKALALEILERGLSVTLWGNIRFEKAFTPDLCRLLAAAGMVLVTGGLEVANERLLQVIDKGVTVEQVAQAAAAFRGAGIMVHAYLMYGFPTQTDQETIDSMELVRQLFEHELITSAFWHRFVLTRHAPIFRDPLRFSVEIAEDSNDAFAKNDVHHIDESGGDHSRFDDVLPRALASWLRSEDLGMPVEQWFDEPMIGSSESPQRIERALAAPSTRDDGRALWLGGACLEIDGGLVLHHADGEILVTGSDEEMAWLGEVIEHAAPGREPLPMAAVRDSFPGRWSDFGERWQSIRAIGLVIV